ncbi:MAG: hypothetical protein CMM15_02505 [Rhodospirillaceae bacterium]|nr:hypothetical protein [Rhodospirillaceae bacterium]|tara:strand:- start:500 stop:763 length:264 start_codon:yes stop_codon:yes gene_type:complete
MSNFIDVQDIAIRNRIATGGRVNPTVEDWNNLLTHIDQLEQENAEIREASLLLIDSLHLITQMMFDKHQDRNEFLKSKQNLRKLLNK